jgi:hypothetical protein
LQPKRYKWVLCQSHQFCRNSVKSFKLSLTSRGDSKRFIKPLLKFGSNPLKVRIRKTPSAQNRFYKWLVQDVLTVHPNGVCPVAQEVQGRVFHRKRDVDFPQIRQTSSQTDFPPFPSVPRRCSGFCSGLNGGLTQIPTTWESRMKRRIKRNPLILFSGLKLNLNFKMVRAAGVEPTTFGSGGRRSIQLSYARKATSKIPARTALLKWNLRGFPTRPIRPGG